MAARDGDGSRGLRCKQQGAPAAMPAASQPGSHHSPEPPRVRGRVAGSQAAGRPAGGA